MRSRKIRNDLGCHSGHCYVCQLHPVSWSAPINEAITSQEYGDTFWAETTLVDSRVNTYFFPRELENPPNPPQQVVSWIFGIRLEPLLPSVARNLREIRTDLRVAGVRSRCSYNCRVYPPTIHVQDAVARSPRTVHGMKCILNQSDGTR